MLTLCRPWSRTNHKWSHEVYGAVLKGQRPIATKEECETAPEGFVQLMRLAYHQDPKNRPPFPDISQALNEMRIQLHHSKHGSLASSSMSRQNSSRSMRSGSIMSFTNKTGSEGDLLFGSRIDSTDSDFIPLHGRSSSSLRTRSMNNSTLMTLGCCAPSPPPKHSMFEMKSKKRKKKK